MIFFYSAKSRHPRKIYTYRTHQTAVLEWSKKDLVNVLRSSKIGIGTYLFCGRTKHFLKVIPFFGDCWSHDNNVASFLKSPIKGEETDFLCSVKEAVVKVKYSHPIIIADSQSRLCFCCHCDMKWLFDLSQADFCEKCNKKWYKFIFFVSNFLKHNNVQTKIIKRELVTENPNLPLSYTSQ